MAIGRETGVVDLPDIFRRVQAEMVAHLSSSRAFEHKSTKGAASEQDWLGLLRAYLPKRYQAQPAFVLNAEGRSSKQIDIAIFDALGSSPLYPHKSGVYVPVESVYAVVEVKTKLTATELMDAGEKIASVRCLRQMSARPILGVVCATAGSARVALFEKMLRRAMPQMSPVFRVDLGCALSCCGFENGEEIVVSFQEEALIFFLLRLLARVEELGPVPPADLMRYGRGLASFQDRAA